MFRPTLRVATLQVVLCGFAAGVAYALGGVSAGLSAGSGASAALAGTLLLVAREKQSELHSGWNAERNLLQFYRSGLERFVLVAVLLAVLFSYSGSVHLAVLAGFLVTQSAWLLALW